jgi:CrcB protein
MLMEEIIAVLIFGAIGSLGRFFLSRVINELLPKNFPWGILVVNITGCFLIGFLAAALVGRYELNAFWRAGIFIGFLGGYTTFSSFSLDTISLLQAQNYTAGIINIVASLLFSLLATTVGILLGKAVS